MSDHSLTTPPPGGRGCGTRKKGGVYACCGTSPWGRPLEDFLVDPPVPIDGPHWQSLKMAPEAILPEGWDGERKVLLLDYIGEGNYPTAPSHLEEVRRFGRSAAVPATMDFSQWAGKKIFVGDVHARAIPVYRHVWRDGSGSDVLPQWHFPDCKWFASVERGREEPSHLFGHYPDCIFHLWPLAMRMQEVRLARIEVIPIDGMPDETSALPTEIVEPWGAWSPFGVVEWDRTFNVLNRREEDADPDFDPDQDTIITGAKWFNPNVTDEMRLTRMQELEAQAGAYPEVIAWEMGLVAIFPITHIEIIQTHPEGCNVGDSGLPVEIVEE